MIFKNAFVLNDDFEFKKEDLKVKNGVFSEIGNFEENGINSENLYIIPGLVDIHIHGSAGHNCEDDNSIALEKISEYLATVGTTSFLATFSSVSKEKLLKASKRSVSAFENGLSGANIAGIHMEGPYISKKYCGAMDLSQIRKPCKEEIDEILDITGNALKIVSIAPEIDGAMEFIKNYNDKFVISMGHTDSDYETGKQAINCGATSVTHTFNAMRPLHHRNPNMIGAAFGSDIFMELICDGFHVHPEMVKTAYKLCGPERLVLITDSLSSAGVADGIYHECGIEIFVKDGKAMMADGTIAGGTTPLFMCMKNLVSYGVPFNNAVKCASINPARAARIDDKYGSITVGKSADFLVLDSEFNLKSVYVRGEKIHG